MAPCEVCGEERGQAADPCVFLNNGDIAFLESVRERLAGPGSPGVHDKLGSLIERLKRMVP